MTDTQNLQRSLRTVLSWFRAKGSAVFSATDLKHLVDRNRVEWGLEKDLDPKRVVAELLKTNELEEAVLASLSTKYAPIRRYLCGTPTPFEVAISISRGYLSHASALYLHGLTDQIPTTLYANREQSPKPVPDGELTQASIDRAFRAPQRRTNLVFAYTGFQLALLAGKNTQRRGVIELPGGEFAGLPLTSIERTLIDVSVRPDYAGGVVQVAKAFERAKGRFSSARLVETLKALAYVYPYHQALGFYLERAGYAAEDCEPLRALGLRFDFYLAHAMKDTRLDPSWRVYHPKWL